MAQDHMSPYRMVVIGGSAGSLEVIMKIVSALPQKTKASFLIVVHRTSAPESVLESILATRTVLPVKEAEDKETIEAATIYLAPADYHLLIESDHCFSLDASEKVNFCRPSIDVSFESAADVYGPNLIGVLLSGANADGALGLQRIAMLDGYTIAQQPKTADVGFMPQQAINLGSVNTILGADEIGPFLQDLLRD